VSRSTPTAVSSEVGTYCAATGKALLASMPRRAVGAGEELAGGRL
jgi:DNA-binding IclR family transcriptional regulator